MLLGMTTRSDLIRRLEMHTAALALPEGRRVGQPGHEVARNYLRQELERLSMSPFRGETLELPYERPHPDTRRPQSFTNLAGVLPGSDRSLPPLLLGAHYDSVIDAPSADDNATSVALTLCLAEEFAARPLRRDLVIALFDAEEPPFFLGESMGSRRFCEDHCQDLRFACVVISDLVGHDFRATDLQLPAAVDHLLPGIRQLLFVLGSESNEALPEIVEECAGKVSRLRVVPTLHRYVGPMSDHAAFADAGQPFLFLSCGQGRHYHTPQDTLEWINFRKLARVTRFVGHLLSRIDSEPPQQAHRPTCDPVEFELRLLRQAIGPLAKPLLKQAGIAMPTSRGDLDRLLGSLIDRSLQ